MARQGKGADSPIKAVFKKVKKAATKARQDLAGAFVTKSGKAVFYINLDVVDESPTQISKKSVMIPASSLAPQYSPKKAQAELKKKLTRS